MRFACLTWLILTGCLPPRVRSPADQAPIVKAVRFEGNGGALSGTGDYLLRGAMAQSESPNFWKLAPRRRAVRLDYDELRTDAYRIETWFAHHGFFEARFLGWEVVTREMKGRTPVVTLVGNVDPGPETIISEVRWVVVGQDGQPTGRSFESVVGKPLASLVRRQAAVQPGDRFSLEAHGETKDLTLARLRDRSFAYAEVSGEVVVRADEHEAELEYRCDTGPACRYGEVKLRGKTRVPRGLIRDLIKIEEGDAFSAADLARTQRDLFALGTFSVVNVVPELDVAPKPDDRVEQQATQDSDDDRVPELEAPEEPSDVVPIRVELQDSRWRQLRLGGGVALEDGKQDLHASAEFQHANLLNRLWRLEVETRAGYTWLTQWSSLLSGDDASVEGSETVIVEQTEAEESTTLSGGPSAEIVLGVDIPRFLGRRLRLENELSFELGVEQSYQFLTPTLGTTLAWRPHKFWTFGFGYKLQYFLYFNTIGSFEALSTSGYALDTQNPYFLTTTTQTLFYDSRNDPLNTTRGAFASLGIDEAAPPGNFDFVRMRAEGRLYRPLGRLVERLTTWYPKLYAAGRLGGGWIQPYSLFSEDRSSVPYAERLYLGGSTSVRGWTDDHLGPQVGLCPDGDIATRYAGSQASDDRGPVPGTDLLTEVGSRCQPSDLEHVPIGGLLSAYGSLELRFWLWGRWEDLGFVFFTDAGMVWDEIGEVGEQLPLTSLGLGVRYRTPVGPLRIDLARRFGDPPRFRHEPRYGFYLSLSEAF